MAENTQERQPEHSYSPCRRHAPSYAARGQCRRRCRPIRCRRGAASEAERRSRTSAKYSSTATRRLDHPKGQLSALTLSSGGECIYLSRPSRRERVCTTVCFAVGGGVTLFLSSRLYQPAIESQSTESGDSLLTCHVTDLVASRSVQYFHTLTSLQPKYTSHT